MTKTTTPAVFTTDGRAHGSLTCKRAQAQAFAEVRPRTEVKACTYCKPSPARIEAGLLQFTINETSEKLAVAEAAPVAAAEVPVADPDTTALVIVLQRDRRAGSTLAELAVKYDLPAARVRRLVGDVKPERPAAAPKGRTAKATRTPSPVAAGTGTRPRKDLPSITSEDFDAMLQARQGGTSWRGVEKLVPHLQRSSSPLRKAVLAEAARRGVTA